MASLVLRRVIAGGNRLPIALNSTTSKSCALRIGCKTFASAASSSDNDISNLPGLTEKQLKTIEETDAKLRYRHLQIEGDMGIEERDTVRRKRMIYRSKQRGWLEADLLLGSWAVENVPKLNADELDQYELLLKEETINIYNFISGKDPLPSHLIDLPIMQRLKEYALVGNMASPAGYAKIKKEANLT